MITIKKHQLVYIIIAEMNQLYIADFTDDDATHSFKFKEKITSREPTLAQIIVPLKYLSIFLGTRQLSLINCKINLMLTWSVCLV